MSVEQYDPLIVSVAPSKAEHIEELVNHDLLPSTEELILSRLKKKKTVKLLVCNARVLAQY